MDVGGHFVVHKLCMVCSSPVKSRRIKKWHHLNTHVLGQCVEVIRNFRLGNNGELHKTRVCATTLVCPAGNIPNCCCGAAVLVHAQSSNVRASLTSLRRVEPFSMIIPRAISVYWADAWIELRCPSAHTTGTIPPVVLETFFWCATFVSGRASTVAQSFGHAVVSLLPCGFCHAHLSNCTFTCVSRCVPFSVPYFCLFLWKPAEILVVDIHLCT